MKTLSERLKDHPKVGEVRGMGLEIAVVFVNNKEEMEPDIFFADKVVRQSLINGLFLNLGHAGCIQLMPPLTISMGDLEQGTNLFIQSIEQVI